MVHGKQQSNGGELAGSQPALLLNCTRETVNIYDHPLGLSKLEKIRIKIVRAVSLMVPEAFGQLGRLFFSQCSHFKLGWPAKRLCHCFPDVRTRKERRTAGWAGTFSVLQARGNLDRQASFAGWMVASHFARCLETEKSVTSSLWPLGTLQNLGSLAVTVKKCSVSHSCTVLMGWTWLTDKHILSFHSFQLNLVSSAHLHQYACRIG